MGETLVLMERFDFEGLLKAVERFKVTYMPVSPPLIVALAKSELAEKYDLSSLRLLGCGGAPLGKETAERFVKRFPNGPKNDVDLWRPLWEVYYRFGEIVYSFFDALRIVWNVPELCRKPA
ncbi:hypothetical protein ACLB2K_063246 [Fragaria x ananassa]